MTNITSLQMTNITSQRVVDADHPWLGLTPYSEETREFFFGRDAEVRDLYLRVREQPITILYGQSGLGKTSLLGAGLIPKLRVEGFRPVLLRLGYEPTDPPLIEQAFATVTLFSEGSPSAECKATLPPLTLWERFHDIATRPSIFINSPPVLIFDQFEEIFTLTTTKERQAEALELFRQLADLVENRPPQAVQDRILRDRRLAREYDLGPSPVRVVITLREDFLSYLESYNKLMPSLMRNRMAIRMLNGPQALDAVVRPGRIQGRNLISDEVGARIVRFVANRPPETPMTEIGAVPPLLSLLCDELNQQRLAQGRSLIADGSLDNLEALGQNILDGFYNRSLDDLHPAVRAYVEDRMVTVGGHRNPIAIEDAIVELTAVGVPNPREAINQLVRGRLLCVEERGGTQRLEITHDVLAPLVVRSRDDRRERQRAEKAQGEREAARAHEQSIRWQRAQRLVAVAMTVLAILAFCGLGWAIQSRRFALNANGQAVLQAQKAQEEEKKAKAAQSKADAAAGQLAVQKQELESANTKFKTFLNQVAQSDRVTSRDLWNYGRCRDALAYMARSMDLESQSALDLDQLVAQTSSVTWTPPLALLIGHNDTVWTATFSPDATRIVTASNDKTARIWDANSGIQLANLTGHTELLFSAAFSPDGKRVVTSSYDKTARIWDATSGMSLVSLIGHESGLIGAEFSTDGRRVVTCSHDKTAKIWDAESGRLLATLTGHNGEVYLAHFSPDGKLVVTGSYDNTVKIWDAEKNVPKFTIPENEGRAYFAIFSPNSERLITASRDKSATIWNAATGEKIFVLRNLEPRYEPYRPAARSDLISHAEFSPDGTRIVTASYDNDATIWDASTGDRLFRLSGHENELNTARFSSDGGRIVTSSDDKTAKIWDASTGRLLATLVGHNGPLRAAHFSPDGSLIVTSSYKGDKIVRVWDSAIVSTNLPLSGHHDILQSAEFSPDGTLIVTASSDRTARIWDAATGASLHSLIGHAGRLRSAQFSPDGKRVVTSSEDRTARLWDAATGVSIATLKGHDDALRTATFSPDGTRIVTASNDKAIGVWDTSTGRRLGVFTGHENLILSAEFSPDGARILTASADKTARIWDSVSGLQLSVLVGHEDLVLNARFSPDGRRIVTASNDKTSIIWDVESGQPVFELADHDSSVLDAAFSPDGNRIVTVSERGTASFWDSATGGFLNTLSRHESGVLSAEFSRDGSRVVTASNDRTARIWDAETGLLLATLNGHGDSVRRAKFSSDGKRIVTCSDDKSARVWNAASVTTSPPGWFNSFLLFLGQRTHNSQGELADWPSNAESSQDVSELRKSLSKDQTRYGEIARYFLTPPPDRPVFPGSKITCRQAADRLIQPGASKDDLDRAYGWYPAHPLIQIAISDFSVHRELLPVPSVRYVQRKVTAYRKDANGNEEPYDTYQTVAETYTEYLTVEYSDYKGVGTSNTQSPLLDEQHVCRLLRRQPNGSESADQIATLCCRAVSMLLNRRDVDRASRVLDRAASLAPLHPGLPRLRERLQLLKNSLSFPPPPPAAAPLPDVFDPEDILKRRWDGKILEV